MFKVYNHLDVLPDSTSLKLFPGQWVVMEGRKVVCVFQCLPVADGVEEVTMMMGNPPSNTLAFVRQAGQVLSAVRAERGLYRLQATTSTPKSARLLKLIGFEFEGVLKDYGGPGQHYKMWRLL